jgi:NAD(P)-dependent dehydrogenase (short-subunit alcohol dehydrogenase family)
MDINLKAVYFVSQGAAKLMKEQESGIIINLASDAEMRAAASP